MGIPMLNELVRRRVSAVVSVALGSLLVASCSSTITRFDFPTFGLGKSHDSAPSDTVMLRSSARLGESDTGSGYMRGGSSLAEFERDTNPDLAPAQAQNLNSHNSYMPPQTAAPEVRSARYKNVDRQPLAPVAGRREANYAPSSYEQKPMRPIGTEQRSFLPAEPAGYGRAPEVKREAKRYARANPTPRVRPTQQPARRLQAAPGGIVTVSAGDTLYSIGRRYGVSVVQLMETNQLADSNIRIGQRLRIPTDTGGSGVAVAKAAPARSPSLHAAATSTGTYTVRPGDSFQAIAERLKVDTAQLADINGITDPGSIRPGEVLILPAKMARRKLAKASPQKAAVQDDVIVRPVKTKRIKLAALKENDNTLTDAAPARPAATEKQASFRWPVQGRIIGKFGSRGDGTHNDGINLAVPAGTIVKAAEDGVVAYAGSELKGYGNLVLIRHAGGWVSAYAHNQKLLVKRGDQVKRGQEIARAGNTGSVDQPQVHFELRKGSKPVDPLSYMSGA